MPYCMDNLSFTVPLCVPDPPDSTKIPCYNKPQVSPLLIAIIVTLLCVVRTQY